MKTPEQLNGAVRNISKKNNLFPQEVLQMFFFERFLERLSVSKYKNNFILKGGLLISSMIGLAERTTMDMDTTVKGIPMEEDIIESIVKEIIKMDVGDGILFDFIKMAPIRKGDAYNDFRVHLQIKYGKIDSPMKIDITTGDKITPTAIEYPYKMMFEDREIPVMAYPIETILAEKFETIIRRNIGNTRARDFYDLYVLFNSRKGEIRKEILRTAIKHTAEKRDSLEELKVYKEICDELRKETAIRLLWENYAKENSYAEHLLYEEIIDNVENLGKYIES